MVRNKNVEILRASAILFVLLYHFYVILGKPISSNTIANALLSMGGELGVTMFFVLSGFGVYLLLNSKKYSYGEFIKSRLYKLIPEYYICLIVLLLLTEQSVYLNEVHIGNVLSHFVFLHSFNISYHGAINGSLWTMSILMQFYIFAYAIWYGMRRNLIYPKLLIVGSLLVKNYIYHVFLPQHELQDSIYYFIYGRQLFTALDNFVVGMLVAEMLQRGKRIERPAIAAIAGLLMLAGWLIYGYHKGIYSANVFSVIWHFVCAVLCGCLIFAFFSAKEYNSIFIKPFHWIARYNYGIYLWHLVLANNLLTHCEWVGRLNYATFVILMIALSCVAGYFSSYFSKCFMKSTK